MFKKIKGLYLFQEHKIILHGCPFVYFLLVPVDCNKGDGVWLLILALAAAGNQRLLASD